MTTNDTDAAAGPDEDTSAAAATGVHATRLESLLLLVRDGSSAQIRENAAEQLGEVAVRSPASCRVIVQHVRELVTDPEWDVRIAASKCLEVIARALRSQRVQLARAFAAVSLGSDDDNDAPSAALTFERVNIHRVVRDGAPLLRSGGEEYQFETNLSPEQRRLQALQQRRVLLRRISGSAAPIWTTREDALAQQMLPRLNAAHIKDIADDIARDETDDCAAAAAPVPSTKRAAAELLDTEWRYSRAAAANKKRKTLDNNANDDNDDDDDAALLQLVAELAADLFESVFSAKWEVRHGALLALRQLVLASQLPLALTAGADSDAPTAQMRAWRDECLVRCVCVLALDQFVDYSADGSVAPVREVGAQVFGALLGTVRSDAPRLAEYLAVLRALFRGATWHAAHGALLGLTYLVRAHRPHAPTLLPLVLCDVLDAFERATADDDVRVRAAELLEAATPYLALTPAAQLCDAATLLWTALDAPRTGDTNTSASPLVPAAAVRALSAWYSHKSVRAVLDADAALATLAASRLRRVVPLLHEPVSTVRRAALQCAAAMAQTPLPLSFVRFLLPHLLLQLLHERECALGAVVLDVWKRTVHASACAGQLVAAVADDLAVWTELLWSTAGIERLNVTYNRSSDSDDNDDDDVSSKAAGTVDSDTNSTARVSLADAIGFLAAHVPLASPTYDALAQRLCESVESASGERQCGALLTVAHWAEYERANASASSPDDSVASRVAVLQHALGPALEALARNDWVAPSREPHYSEQRGLLQRVRIMERRIFEIFTASGVACGSPPPSPNPSDSIASASNSVAAASRRIAERVAALPYAQLAAQPLAFERTHFKRQDLFVLDDALQQAAAQFAHRVMGLASCAYSRVLAVPPKRSGFLVKALMAALKHETNRDFQRLAARAVADFAVAQAPTQRKCVVKIVTNLCHSAAALAVSEIDDIDILDSVENVDTSSDTDNDDTDIAAEAAALGLTPDALRRARVRVSGAEIALRSICATAGARVFALCPALHDAVARAWTDVPRDDRNVQQSAHLVRTVVGSVDPQAFAMCLDWLRELAMLVTQPLQLGVTRVAVARAIASVCRHAAADRDNAMTIVYEQVFAVFERAVAAVANGDDALRGALLVLHHVVHALAPGDLVPFVPSLVHYAMRAMSTPRAELRALAARTFAELVPLVPLQMDLPRAAAETSGCVVGDANAVSRAFLQRLLAGRAVRRVDVAHVLALNVALRAYQQHGIDWLVFLFEHGLHGVLADDMGLGKTLQTLVAIAAWLHPAVDTVDTVTTTTLAPCCLVVCPPVVTSHWVTEARERLVAGAFAHIVEYAGAPAEREALRESIATARRDSAILTNSRPVLVVTTYAALRADATYFASLDLAVAVLDEAHVVRNPSTSLFAAVQQLAAARRVALSGTPLQNSVGDLWALFAFVLPGYLGAAARFQREYARPIARARARHATPAHKEAAALALARLHQRALPFVLRRTKHQVLRELPPKIVSNVLTALTPVQRKLYNWASGNQSDGRDEDNVDHAKTTAASTNVLASLQLLRRICVHPSLVPRAALVQQLSAAEVKAAAQWDSSGKLVALRDLLVDACDLGRADAIDNAMSDNSAVAAPHRVLVFAQLQDTLDVVERMFASALPHITFRRLDGRTAPAQRARVVQQFNEDVSIDVLLLTTAVGGLGLTLTGADTVIFLEHAWNPFVDLQAMDRAHRIGQRRVVRVFRVLARATLEEHILDLQAFKERVATTVVAANDAQSSMGARTTELLQLLQQSSKATASAVKATASVSTTELAASLPASAQALLGQLGELWDQSQYDSLAFPDDLEQP